MLKNFRSLILGLIILVILTIPVDRVRAYGDWAYSNLGPGVKDNLGLIKQELGKLSPQEWEVFQNDQQFILDQIQRTAHEIPKDQYPVHTYKDGSWMLQNEQVWVASHWIGMLWLAHRQTQQPEYKAWAEQWMIPLEKRRTDSWTHDHGFLFGLSYVKGSELVEDQKIQSKYRQIALAAAKTYITKAHPYNGFILWHGTPHDPKSKGESVIDSMMNVELMWWATEQTGDKKFAEVGLKQAENVRKYMVRSDFSTSHGVTFDLRTGKNIRQATFQGWADDSCWSRGQAWAIYGFTQVYAKTGNKIYLETARGVSDYFLNHLPDDQVPYWDFAAPQIPKGPYPNPMVRDSSAASTAASGLIDLARFETDPVLAVKYLKAAVAILKSLSTPNYLSKGTKQLGVLQHGCQFFKRFDKDYDNIDSCNIWGDYYFMEALDKLKRWK